MKLKIWPSRLARSATVIGVVAVAAALGSVLIGGRHDDRRIEKAKIQLPSVGHLGGQPVSIPPEYANWLEYDQDPHFMTPRNGMPPARTEQSGIRSFGFDIRYAELMSRYGDAPGKQIEDNKLDTSLHIGIKSNSYYRGDEQVVSLADSTASRLGQPYARQDENKYGLEAYAPMSAVLANSPKLIRRSKDIYLHRRPDGTADVYIECSRLPAAKSCSLDYSLAPELKVSVAIIFPRRRLSEWAMIQSSVSAIILGFKRAA